MVSIAQDSEWHSGACYDMGLDVTKPVFGFSDKVRLNQPAQLQALASILKFRL